MRRMLLCAFALLFLLTAIGCGKKEKDIFSVREKIQKNVKLPVGVWYQSGKNAWEEGYLPESLRRLLFEREDEEGLTYCVYLGTQAESLCEIVLLSCESEADADHLSAVLSLRLATLQELGAESFPQSFSDAAVTRQGKTVFYTVGPCNREVGLCLK